MNHRKKIQNNRNYSRERGEGRHETRRMKVIETEGRQEREKGGRKGGGKREWVM